MQKNNNLEKGVIMAIDRRKFLKVGLASTSVGLVKINAIPLIDTSILDTTGTGLTSASHFGAFKAIKNSGKLTGVTPFEDEFPSPMLRAIPDRTYSPTRVKYPYVREGYLKDGYKSDSSKRGSDNFVRVSWDKALELIANEIKRVQKINKGNSIFAGSYGWKCVGKLHNPQVLLYRMLTLSGGYVGHSSDY
jgi:trimethylamine-N-oxide reductase (cytochrome c)